MWKILLVLTLVLAACSGSSSEGPLLTFADFANPPTTSEALGSTSTTTPSTTTPSSTSTTTTTLLVVDTPAPVTVRSDSGFLTLEGLGAPRRILDAPVEAGFDDLSGGFLFQAPGAGVDLAADQRVFWARAANPEAQPYLKVSDGSLLKLWGVELIEGSPAMILTITDHAADPELRVQRLVVFDFKTFDRVLGEVGDGASGPLSISYSGGRFLLEQSAGVQQFFEFRNPQGAVLSLESNPQPGCSEDPTCPMRPTLDPTGSLIAYVEGSELVVHDLDLNEELNRLPMATALSEVTGLDFDGSTIIVNRQGAPALVVDVRSGVFGEFGLTGEVHFLRVGPAFDGQSAFAS
ncbi:MAG: hypothetical protein OER12_07260 [Acidimicrobiia bacterium]|nr:hypothetical protein [Acidimicrobiia bacterium]